MPKLKDHLFFERNDAGTEFRHKAIVNVDKEGRFSVSIPNEDKDVFLRIAQKLVRGGEWRYTVEVKTAPANNFVVCKDLGKAIQFVHALIRDYMACRSVTTLVICYRRLTNFHAAQDTEGRLGPDGNHLPGDYDGDWVGTKKSCFMSDNYEFSIGIFAKVVKKITSTFNSHTKVVYEEPEEEEIGPAAQYLNAFNFEGRGGLGKRTAGEWSPEVEEIPYTEEAAHFFGQMLLGICETARRMDDFFTEPDALQAAICQQKTLTMRPPV